MNNKNAIKYATTVGSALAFQEVLSYLEKGMNLNKLKAQMILNIDSCEKIQEQLKNED